MIALKLALVPTFLLLVSLAGRRWGPAVAGWLAGLPVVAGPILYLLAIEQGPVFASTAAAAALAAVLASVSFSLAYAHGARSMRWPLAMLVGLMAWLVTASLLAVAPPSLTVSAIVALGALLLAPRLFPRPDGALAGRAIGRAELGLRMLAGGALTMGVTLLAGAVGPRWSGLLAVFPVLGIVLAVFSHRAQGAAFAGTLLRAMATGLYSFAAFCLVLALALRQASMPAAFTVAVVASLAVQMASRQFLATSARRSTLTRAEG